MCTWLQIDFSVGSYRKTSWIEFPLRFSLESIFPALMYSMLQSDSAWHYFSSYFFPSFSKIQHLKKNPNLLKVISDPYNFTVTSSREYLEQSNQHIDILTPKASERRVQIIQFPLWSWIKNVNQLLSCNLLIIASEEKYRVALQWSKNEITFSFVFYFNTHSELDCIFYPICPK